MQRSLILALLMCIRRRRMKKKSIRRFHVHPINAARKIWGAYHHLLPELKMDVEKFYAYFRMDQALFSKLLSLVCSRIQKTAIREVVCPKERLMVTLRYLATGETFHSLHFQFRLGVSTIVMIVRDTCNAIFECLHQDYLRTPRTPEAWMEISAGIQKNCNFPNAIGCIDGKHVLVRKPPKSETLFFNYKGSTSTVLIAVCDSRHYINYASWGHYGHEGDAGIYARSDFKRALDSGCLEIPNPQKLPQTDTFVPFVFLGDGAFPLTTHMMKPFPGRQLSSRDQIFNYRLSRARRLIENCFGIMAAVHRVLLKPMEVHAANADRIIKACLCLHNFRIAHGLLQDLAEEWRQEVDPLPQAELGSVASSMNGRELRETLADYFIHEGRVEWQERLLGLSSSGTENYE